MKIYEIWKRNEKNTVYGESIKVTIIYCSHDKREIDELEKTLPEGMMVIDTDRKQEIQGQQ